MPALKKSLGTSSSDSKDLIDKKLDAMNQAKKKIQASLHHLHDSTHKKNSDTSGFLHRRLNAINMAEQKLMKEKAKRTSDPRMGDHSSKDYSDKEMPGFHDMNKKYPAMNEKKKQIPYNTDSKMSTQESKQNAAKTQEMLHELKSLKATVGQLVGKMNNMEHPSKKIKPESFNNDSDDVDLEYSKMEDSMSDSEMYDYSETEVTGEMSAKKDFPDSSMSKNSYDNDMTKEIYEDMNYEQDYPKGKEKRSVSLQPLDIRSFTQDVMMDVEKTEDDVLKKIVAALSGEDTDTK